jgi:hypothetical protein
VLRDVGDPQLIRRRASEVAIDQFNGGRGVVLRPGPAPVGQALDPGSAHEQLDGVVPGDDAAAEK